MKIITYDRSQSKPIDRYGSIAASGISLSDGFGAMNIRYIHLGPGSLLGAHPATNQQLMLVIDGQGWVRSGSGEMTPIDAWQAVLWDQGEIHESGSQSGMNMLIVECDEFSFP